MEEILDNNFIEDMSESIVEGMSIMAAATQRMIVALQINGFNSEDTIHNILLYLDDFVKINPEIVMEIFKDMKPLKPMMKLEND